MKMWQRVLLITACVILCAVFGAVAYVYAKWSKIDTQDIKAEDIVINEEVKMNKEVDLGDGYTNVALLELIPVMEISERKPHRLYHRCKSE